jgi:hypothetical protein
VQVVHLDVAEGAEPGEDVGELAQHALPDPHGRGGVHQQLQLDLAARRLVEGGQQQAARLGGALHGGAFVQLAAGRAGWPRGRAVALQRPQSAFQFEEAGQRTRLGDADAQGVPGQG